MTDFKTHWEYVGPKIVEVSHLVKIVEDWSKVRSPSRAARRLKQGHRQNILLREVPADPIHDSQTNTIYMHPEMYAEIKRRVADKAVGIQSDLERRFYEKGFGL